jgi:hypothetical protein
MVVKSNNKINKIMHTRIFKLPANNVTPLVKTERQVTMRLNPFSIRRVHDRFRCRTNSNRFREIRLTTTQKINNKTPQKIKISKYRRLKKKGEGRLEERTRGSPKRLRERNLQCGPFRARELWQRRTWGSSSLRLRAPQSPRRKILKFHQYR